MVQRTIPRAEIDRVNALLGSKRAAPDHPIYSERTVDHILAPYAA